MWIEETKKKQHHVQRGEEVHRGKGRAAGHRSTALLTQLESCELVVNGVLIQRRWDFQSKHITKLCALMWADYTHWRLTVSVRNITNSALLWGHSISVHSTRLNCLEAQNCFLIYRCCFSSTLLSLTWMPKADCCGGWAMGLSTLTINPYVSVSTATHTEEFRTSLECKLPF